MYNKVVNIDIKSLFKELVLLFELAYDIDASINGKVIWLDEKFTSTKER